MFMDIERRILELLYFKECVIIPGFGGFVSNYVSASIDEDSQIFQPPTKKIGFNPDLIHDDGILVHYLSRTGLITHIEARAGVDRLHQDILEQLKIKGRYHMESIGEFSYARTGEIVFTVNSDMNFLPESYGLASFHFVKTQSQEHPLLGTAVFRHGNKVLTVPVPGKEPVIETRMPLRRIAMAIPLLLAVSLLPLNTRQGLQKKSPASIIPLPSLKIDLGVNEADNDGSASKHKDHKTGNTDVPVAFNRDSYAIVAGSFSTSDNASKLSDELAGMGHRTEIWEASNGFYRVVIQAHESATLAREALQELQESLPGIEFWVLR